MSDSPLLRLPAELRNRIYELVLPTNPAVLVGDVDGTFWWRTPALLQTCQHIRHESAPLYYSSKIFTITPGRGRDEDKLLQGWLGVIGVRNRGCLRVIRLNRRFYPDDEVEGRIRKCRAGLEERDLQIDGAKIFVEVHVDRSRSGLYADTWRSA